MAEIRNKTKKQRNHVGYMIDVMEQLEWDLHQPIIHRRRIPYAWGEIANGNYPKAKTKITIGIEGDILKFFKMQGVGYQVRINKVLRAFMEARLSGLLENEDTLEEYRDWRDFPERPEIGDFDAGTDDLSLRLKARRERLAAEEAQDEKEAEAETPPNCKS